MPDIAGIVSTTTQKLIEAADSLLKETTRQKGESASLGFEGTAFYLPLSYALTGSEIKDLKGAKDIIAQARLLSKKESLANGLKILPLDGLLSQGMATLLAEELLAALTQAPVEGYLGFVPDTVLRSLGVQLVDGRIAGIAVILGRAKDTASAVKIIQGFQERNIVCLLVGNKGEKNIRDQLIEARVELGLDNYIVPLGSQELSSIFAVNFAIRAALTILA